MKRIFGILLFCALPSVLSAQLDLNALKRQSDSRAQQRKQDSGEFQSDRNAQWGSFMDTRKEEWGKTIASRDVEWTGFLSDTEWTLFDGFLTDKRPDIPKPDSMPQAEPVLQPEPQPVAVPQKSVVQTPPVIPSIEPEAEQLPCKPAEPVISAKNVSFKFYGRPLSIGLEMTVSELGAVKATQKEISNFWKELSETNYTPSVTSLLQEKSEIGLNDWGYYLLVRQFAQNVFSDWNSAMLLTWFILVRSGYDVRVGIAGADVVLLLPSETEIFDVSYLMIAAQKYYIISENKCSSLHTYEGNYQEGCQFDMFQRQPLTFQGKASVRRLGFTFQNRDYTFDFKYDQDVIEYYRALPQAQAEVFFDAAPSVSLRCSIEENLKPIVQGMNRSEALNFLLQFVQLSFQYKTDGQQFGYEKYFYADELFAYPYCDCEDRSVLFSYLARTLLGYEVVGIEFPGHMATAVALDYDAAGTQYQCGGKKYTVADPTYMNARVGQCMPKYKDTTPIIHRIDILK